MAPRNTELGLPLGVVSSLLLGLFVASCHAGAGPVYFVSSSLSLGDPVEYSSMSAQDLANRLVTAVDESAEAGAKGPQAVLLVASEGTLEHSTLTSSDTRLEDTMRIKKVVDLASSSTVFTSVGQSCQAGTVVDAMLSAASVKPGNVGFSGITLGGSCNRARESKGSTGHGDGNGNGDGDEDAQSSGDVQSFVRSWAASSASEGSTSAAPQLLVYCVPIGAALPEPNAPVDNAATPAATATPGSAFLQAYLSLSNSSANFAVVLVPGVLSQEEQGSCRRTLAMSSLPAPPAKSPCDATCETKAALWEALLVSLVLIFAVVSGLCCLVDLDTPSRFEAPREAS